LPRQSLLHAPAQKISRIVVRRGSISNANHFPKWVKIQCNSTLKAQVGAVPVSEYVSYLAHG
jgi:hypothetical protein